MPPFGSKACAGALSALAAAHLARKSERHFVRGAVLVDDAPRGTAPFPQMHGRTEREGCEDGSRGVRPRGADWTLGLAVHAWHASSGEARGDGAAHAPSSTARSTRVAPVVMQPQPDVDLVVVACAIGQMYAPFAAIAMNFHGRSPSASISAPQLLMGSTGSGPPRGPLGHQRRRVDRLVLYPPVESVARCSYQAPHRLVRVVPTGPDSTLELPHRVRRAAARGRGGGRESRGSADGEWPRAARLLASGDAQACAGTEAAAGHPAPVRRLRTAPRTLHVYLPTIHQPHRVGARRRKLGGCTIEAYRTMVATSSRCPALTSTTACGDAAAAPRPGRASDAAGAAR